MSLVLPFLNPSAGCPRPGGYFPRCLRWRGYLSLSVVMTAGCAMYGPESAPNAAPFPMDAPPPHVAAASIEAAAAAKAAATVYYESGQRLAGLGDMDRAAENYRLAIQIDPFLYGAHYRLAELLARHPEGKTAEAVRLLRDLVSNPMSEERENRKLRQAAETLLMELDEVSSALAEAAHLLFMSGRQAEAAGRNRNAMDLYTKAFELWPAHSEARIRAESLNRRHKIRISPPMEAPTMSDVTVALSELPVVTSEETGGKILFNTTRWRGLPMYNGGKAYRQGIWAPAPSSITFSLEGRYQRFTATAFVSAFASPDKEQLAALERELTKPGVGAVRFRVMGDGVLLWESDTVTYARGVLPVSVDVANVQSLTLITLAAGDNNTLDFSVWADARVQRR